jgi:hypothetical protein
MHRAKKPPDAYKGAKEARVSHRSTRRNIGSFGERVSLNKWKCVSTLRGHSPAEHACGLRIVELYYPGFACASHHAGAFVVHRQADDSVGSDAKGGS